MVGIKIQDTFLSLYPNTSPVFQLHHPISIVTEGADRLQGSYTLPVDIPIDEVNRGIIGKINRLDIDSTLMQNEPCQVWADGVLMFEGKATIKGAGNLRAKLFITFNDVKALADVHLASLDLGGDREIGDTAAERTAHAKATSDNPLDYDYVFCPVYNPGFYPEGDAPEEFLQSKYQNFWTPVPGYVENDYNAATPFIRFDYLLRRIFAAVGLTLDNQWQTTDELKLLLLWNNYNISQLDTEEFETWTSTINLVNHVPYRRALDFVNAVLSTFALGLFPDPETKKVLLIPFRDLITGPIAEDWTSRAAAAFGYETDRDFICKFRYDVDENDDFSIQYSGTVYPPHGVFGEGLTPRIMHGNDEHFIRFAIADNAYYLISPLPVFVSDYIYQDQKPVVKEGSDKEYISPIIPMWTSWDIMLDGSIDASSPFQEWMLPTISHLGYIPNSARVNKTLTSFRSMIYRGYQPADVGIDSPYPMASSTPYNIRGELIGAQSLHWDGEYGIYNTHWKTVYEMLRTKKTVTRTLLLTLVDILNFRFWKKYRIENQNVFFTKLEFALSPATRGKYLVEATMITVHQ